MFELNGLQGMTILFLSMTSIMYGAVILTYDDHQPSPEIEHVTQEQSQTPSDTTQHNTNITNHGTEPLEEDITLKDDTGTVLDSHTATISPNTTKTVPLNVTGQELENTSTTHITTSTQNYSTPVTEEHSDTDFTVEPLEKHSTQSYHSDSQSFTSNIRNHGDQTATETVELTTRDLTDGTRNVVDEEELTLEANESKQVTLTSENTEYSDQLHFVETSTDSKPFIEPACASDSDALQVGIEETLGSFFGFEDSDTESC